MERREGEREEVERVEVSDSKGKSAETLMPAGWRLFMLRVNIPLLVTGWGLAREDEGSGEGEGGGEGVERAEERELSSCR